MYQYERNSRVYMQGDGDSSRPSSRSPLEDTSNRSHHRSSQAIHSNGTHNGTSQQHHSTTRSLRDSQQRAVSTELGELTAPGETKTKTQMARAFQESQELYKTADSKAGLQTVKTKRVLKKTTTITKGENEKFEDDGKFREILLRWAQKTTDGYPGCKVVDLTKSWRDGLAFNAIIHRNRPDLLNYRACCKKTSLENLDQAFAVAERDLGVTRLLEPKDVDVPCPDEKSMITYLAQLYELFPNPPERNPLLDEEMIRRIDEYKELASRLLKWIKDSTGRMDERRLPKEVAELKRLKQELDQFRQDEVPPKQHDKQRLASVSGEIYRMAQDVNVRIPDELHIDNIDYHWDRLMAALKNRSKALDDELAKLERLKALLQKLLDDIRKCNDRLDGIERQIDDENRRVARWETLRDAEAYSPQVFQRISEDLADVGIKIDSIKRLAADFVNENGPTQPDSVMVREKVSELEGRYKKLLAKMNRLRDDYNSQLKRLRELDEASRRSQAQRDALAKLRLKLDEMKRQLDELERRIDTMGPVAKDIGTLQRQLAELHKFDEDLSKAKVNLNELISLAERMIGDDLIADPPALRKELQALKDQLARIEDKAARRLREFEEALKRAERQKAAENEMLMKLDKLRRELEELERRIDSMAPVAKDLGTLKKQLEEMRAFGDDVERTRRNLNDAIRLAEDMIRSELISEPAKLRAQMGELKEIMSRIDDKMARRLRALQDALNRAEAQEAAEKKYQLKLEAMRRELEELERQLDSMAPVAKDLGTLQQQLEEMEQFNEKLARTKKNLAELLKAGEDLIRDDLIADPEALRGDMRKLRDHLKRIEDKANKRLRDIQDAMSRCAASDAIGEVAKFLAQAKKVLMEEENVAGDLDTVNALIEQHKSFQDQLQAHQPAMNEIKQMERELSSSGAASAQTSQLIRDQLQALMEQWREVERLSRDKSAKLKDSFRQAEQLHQLVHSLLEWLAEAEMKLRFGGALPDDEPTLRAELAEHEKLVRKLQSQNQVKEQTVKLARDILAHCHPDAEPVVKHWINIIETRWEEIEQWAKQRGQRLADHMRSLKELLELVEELLAWLGRHETRLLAEEANELPANVGQLDQMIDVHSSFMEELRKREPDVDRVVKIFAAKSATATSKMIVTTTTTKKREQQQQPGDRSGRLSAAGTRSTTPTSRTSYATYRDEYPEVRQPRARAMVEKWRTVWQLSLDKMQRLKDKVERQKEQERQDKDQEAAAAVRQEKPATDDELIQDELQRQVANCTCAQRYRVYHVGDGRYRFGESQRLRLVRILRSNVMVRVGGGWEPLASFLQKNDPCRAKGRTNVELREQFILPPGASQTMAAFRSKMTRDPGSLPTLGPVTKIREKTDRSMPMSGGGGASSSSRLASPSDYFSESESASRLRSSTSRLSTAGAGRLTPNSPGSGSSSRPSSRYGSELLSPAFGSARGGSRSSDNLR